MSLFALAGDRIDSLDVRDVTNAAKFGSCMDVISAVLGRDRNFVEIA